MLIGILEAGAPPPELTSRFEGYAKMSARLLDDDITARAYNVASGEFPARGSECDAWLITGSAAGVYDPLPWIATLKAFITSTAGSAPMIGICFGHQLMAEAFGGQAIKSPKGWGVGLHTYAIDKTAPWMDSPAPISLPVTHQDQVVAVGPGAEVLGGNAFTPFGVIAYPDRMALTIQAHPEFAPDYLKALIELRRGQRYDDATADAAIAALGAHNDNRRVGGWLSAFARKS